MDWRSPDIYAFSNGLDQSGWAWQFLRRCPAYRADYAWFIGVWRALEADYGTPPRRDFFRWKQDARAWRAESEIAGCGTDTCPGENDQVLIECWISAKWGLRKFPIDPAVEFPEDLVWREPEIPVTPVSPEAIAAMENAPELIALKFDVSLPLTAQLEAARRKLAAIRHSLARTGTLPPSTLRQGMPIWKIWLRLLDALETVTPLPEIARALDLSIPDEAVSAARAMSAGGYRRILLLTE